jgi:hypothetical protein
MNPFDVKKKALGAVKGYGREGIGEMLKKSYGKPAVSISIESMKAEPGMGEAEDEMVEGEGMPLKEAMHEMSEGEMPEAEGMEMKAESMEPKGESKIPPELLEMLLAKLGK